MSESTRSPDPDSLASGLLTALVVACASSFAPFIGLVPWVIWGLAVFLVGAAAAKLSVLLP